MATDEERDKVRLEVKELLDALNDIDSDSLGRRAELSPGINFESVVPEFERMLDVARQLRDRDLTRLPSTELGTIKKALTNLQNHINKVKQFELGQQDPAKVCDDICGGVKSAYDAVVQPMLLPLAFTATQATEYSKLEREAKGFHAQLKQDAKSFSEELEKYRRDAEDALSAIKEQVAEAGVSAHAQNYSTQADLHEKAANGWFNATIVAAISTFVVAVAALIAVFFYTPPSVAEAIQYVVSKLIVLSVLSFALIWCTRNFKSEKHNETVNRHRANSLATFKTFVEGAQDSGTKDAILMFCAHAAFGHQPSGYDGHGSTDAPPQIVNPVVELLGKHESSAATRST